MKWLVCCLGLAAILSACKTDKTLPPAPSVLMEYYPLKEGQVWRWQVSDSSFTETDTLVRQWIETDSFRTWFYGQDGIGILPVDIYSSESFQDSNLVYKSRTASYKTSQFHFEQADNKTVAVLKYPVQNGQVWDANGFSTLENEYRLFKNLHQTYQGISQCLETGLLQPTNSLIDQYDFKEIYAPNIGKVYQKTFSRQYTFMNQSPILIQGFTREKNRIL